MLIPCGPAKKTWMRSSSKRASTGLSKPGLTKAGNMKNRCQCLRQPTLPQRYFVSFKVQFFKGFGFVLNKLTRVILQIPGFSAARPAGTSSSSKVTKRPVSFSSAHAESRKRKSQSVTIGAKSSEDDDALAGLNIPRKK